MWKETSLCEKRPLYPKRDVYMWKKTCKCERRPLFPKRDLYVWKNTSISEKRRLYVKKDLYIRKETSICEEWPPKEAYLFVLNSHLWIKFIEVCRWGTHIVSKETCITEKRPVRVKRDLKEELMCYGVAYVSRIDKMIGLFCKRTLWKKQYSAKETYNFVDPTNRSHPIVLHCHVLMCYGVATISRLLQIIGLFCKRTLWKRRYSAKETCNFKEPTNRSHPIVLHCHVLMCYVVATISKLLQIMGLFCKRTL